MPSMHPNDARRRWFGCFFLFTAGGLLIWGQTVLKPYLGQGVGFILYWMLCFAFTMLAIFTALIDLWVVRIRARQEKRELIERTVKEVLPKDELSKTVLEEQEKQGMED